MNNHYDFIIIGGGTAGCILANRLSANPNYTVLLIEAGRNSDHWKVKLPVGQSMVVANKDWDWQFPALADSSCSNKHALWSAGKCLGGGSSINGMVYVRGNPLDFDHWGVKGWSYQEVLPYFKKIETVKNPMNEYRGTNGLVNVREVIKPHRLAQVFIDAAQELKIPLNPDYNGIHQEGVGLCQTNQSKRLRQNTYLTYLKPALKRKNLRVLTQACVHTINFIGKKAQSVRVMLHNNVESFHPKKEIILCAGAINTPKLLLQSGVGPINELLSACLHPLRGVGKNLQEHPNCWIKGSVNISTYNTDLVPWRGIKHLWQWISKGGGALATPVAHALCFIKTKEELLQPDIQIHFTPFSYEVKEGSFSLTKQPTVVLTPNICRPKTRGSIRLQSMDPSKPPLISYRALAEEDDVQTLLAGCKFATQLLHTKAFSPYLRKENNLLEKHDWADYLTANASLGYHPVGTCKMGNDVDAVVDDRLKVHGLQGLRIADASIMPVITSGNTNAPTMMIAEKAAGLILQDWV